MIVYAVPGLIAVVVVLVAVHVSQADEYSVKAKLTRWLSLEVSKSRARDRSELPSPARSPAVDAHRDAEGHDQLDGATTDMRQLLRHRGRSHG